MPKLKVIPEKTRISLVRVPKANALGFQRTRVRDIVSKFNTVTDFPRGSRPYKIPQELSGFTQEATNAQGQHRRNRRPLLNQWRSLFMTHLSKRHWRKTASMRRKPPLTKKSITPRLNNTPWWSSNLVGECLVDWWVKSVWKPMTESK